MNNFHEPNQMFFQMVIDKKLNYTQNDNIYIQHSEHCLKGHFFEFPTWPLNTG